MHEFLPLNCCLYFFQRDFFQNQKFSSTQHLRYKDCVCISPATPAHIREYARCFFHFSIISLIFKMFMFCLCLSLSYFVNDSVYADKFLLYGRLGIMLQFN